MIPQLTPAEAVVFGLWAALFLAVAVLYRDFLAALPTAALGACRNTVTDAVCAARPPRCGTHGHEDAVVDEWQELRPYERTYTAEFDLSNVPPPGTPPRYQTFVVSGERVLSVETKRCRFCGREKDALETEWYLPDDASNLDVPVADIEAGVREKAEEVCDPPVKDVLRGNQKPMRTPRP